jgi:hypothetical protein
MKNNALPKFAEFLNENSNDQRSIGYDNINGILNIFLKFQETGGYDTMKTVDAPDAELRLTFEDKDTGIIHYYTGDDYENDREKVLKEIRDAADEFDKRLDKILADRKFKQ